MNDDHDNAITDLLERLERLASLNDPCALCGCRRDDHLDYNDYNGKPVVCQGVRVSDDDDETPCDCPGFEDTPPEEDDRDPYEGEILLW